MGMFAEVICIGPYSKEIAEHLGYSKEQYIGTNEGAVVNQTLFGICLLYTSPSPRDRTRSRMPSSA